MSQVESTEKLEEAVGYVLKQAATALRTRMDAALRPLQLTVPQYACMELLAQRSGMSNAELARGAFVSRQSMNGVLRGLQKRELVTRPTTATHGRALPTQLTAKGHEQLRDAHIAVREIEQHMLNSLTPAQQHRLRNDLADCTTALTQ